MKIFLITLKMFLTASILGLSMQSAFAKHYISGAAKVTFRTGPGTDNKILGMLELDEPVTLLEEGDEWSKVKDKTAREGFVMSRFLSKTVPYSVRYSWLLAKHNKLKEEMGELKQSQADLNKYLGDAKRELASTKENLQATSSSFEELKAGSSEYLELKEKYEQTHKKLDGSNKEVALLKEKLSLYYFTWFLAGAGVLLLGWLIGFFSKRRKQGYGSRISL